MGRFLFLLLVGALAVTSLAGCHFSEGSHRTTRQTITPIGEENMFRSGGPAADSSSSPEPISPSMPGNWSEPVNGIRMSVRQVVRGSARAGDSYQDLNLILFVQNVGNEPVNLPRLEPELERRFGSLETMGEMVPDIGGPNLRIITQPLNDQLAEVTSRCFSPLQQRIEVLESPMSPGEIRVVLIQFEGQMQMRQAQQLRELEDGSIEGYAVSWPGLHDTTGFWRVQLVYRPEGFVRQRDAAVSDEAYRLEVDPSWSGQQIVLPPLYIDLNQDGQARQQIRE